MTILTAFLRKITPGWWEVITRVAIISMIIAAYYIGRLNAQREAGATMGTEIKSLKHKLENLTGELRKYKEREKSRTSSDTTTEKPPKNE